MTILQKPNEYNFAGNLPDIVVSSSTPIDFALSKNGDDPFLEETYYPNSNNLINIEIREIIYDLLQVDLPGYGQAIKDQVNGYAEFTVDIDAEEISFYAIAGGIRSLVQTIDQTFLIERFLTWQPESKYIKKSDPQWLSYFSTQVIDVEVIATLSDNSIQTLKMEEGLERDKLYSFDVSYSRIIEIIGSEVQNYSIQILSNLNQTPLSVPSQKYVIHSEFFDYDDIFHFSNSLGGVDTVRFTGLVTKVENFNISNALFGRELKEYFSDPDDSFKKNTGIFRSEREKLWIKDFLSSKSKYHLINNRPIKIVSPSGSHERSKLNVNSYDFEFRYAEPNPNQFFEEILGGDYSDEIPDNFRILIGGPDSLILRWNNIEENPIEVYFSLDGINFGLFASLPSDSEEFIYTGAAQDTDYYFKIKYKNADQSTEIIDRRINGTGLGIDMVIESTFTIS